MIIFEVKMVATLRSKFQQVQCIDGEDVVALVTFGTGGPFQ